MPLPKTSVPELLSCALFSPSSAPWIVSEPSFASDQPLSVGITPPLLIVPVADDSNTSVPSPEIVPPDQANDPDTSSVPDPYKFPL